ncbi:MAG: hypothetical protein VB127_03690 [Sphaerochaeta sp.]|nr:hypothetical protein [Sphaerochaeta sp.]
MVVDKQYLRELRSCYRYDGTKFTEELEQIILDRLGIEPSPHEYSEQDLHEQARKIVMQYQSPEGRLRLLYGLDKIENEMAYLGNKLAYLKGKIAHQLHGETDPNVIFVIEDEDEDVPDYKP